MAKEPRAFAAIGEQIADAAVAMADAIKPQSAAELRTPDEWKALCFPPKNKRGLQHDFAWQHGAASALHRWPQHAHHAGAPIQLSGEAYYEALLAASTPTKTGDYKPHAAALGRY